MNSASRLKTIVRVIGVRFVVCLVVAAMALLLSSDLRNAFLSGFSQSDLSGSSAAEENNDASPASNPLSSASDGNDWPHFRGPSFNGCCDAKDLAGSWPDEGPPVLWMREIGRGYSALIAVGRHLYTQTQGLYRQSVLCLDAETGGIVWQYDYAWPYGAGGMYPGPRATPTWYDNKIYFVGPRGVLGCLRASDGQPIWSVDLEEMFGCRGMDFGYSASPLLEDDKVIVPVGAKGASLVALNAADGSLIWAGGDQAASYCGAVPIMFEDRKLLLIFLQNGLALHDPTDGKVLWETSYSQGYDEHAAMPIYQDGRIMIACPFRSGSRLYNLERDANTNKLTAREVWQSRDMSNDVASSVLIDGCVYGFDLRDIQTKARRPSRGTFRAMDFATGKTLWTSDRPGQAAPVAADGKLFMLNDRGEAILAAADPSGYRELGRIEIFSSEICWTTPTLSRGRLYLRSPTRLACLYVGNEGDLSEGELAIARRASSIKGQSSLDLTWAVGGEREYPFDPPDNKELLLWFRYCVYGVFAPAALLAVLIGLATELILHLRNASSGKRISRRFARVAFWIGLAIGGAIGTSIFNRYNSRFIFTWPVVLFTAQQAVITAIVASSGMSNRIRAGRLSVTAVILFFAVCLLYFDLCQRLDLAMQWVFLIGFLPSWPLAVPAAYVLRRDGRLFWDVLLGLAVFTTYFWACGAFIAWRLGNLWPY